MYQLIQIPLQNFFSILCTNPNTYPASNFFSVFYVPTVPHPLLTSIPTRPARIRTTSQTRRTKPHTHHHTPANTFPRPPPPCRTTVPYSQPYHCTVLPTVQPYHCTTVQPYHCTTVQPYHCTVPRPCRHTTANTTYRTTMPYYCTTPPDTPFPYHAAAPFRPPQAVPMPSRRRRRRDRRARRRRAPPTLATALTRRVDVGAPSRRRPDTVTPLAVPVCRTRLQYPLVGRHPEDKKCESGTGHMPYLEDSTPDPTQARL